MHELHDYVLQDQFFLGFLGWKESVQIIVQAERHVDAISRSISKGVG
jgi:hypothetical protein